MELDISNCGPAFEEPGGSSSAEPARSDHPGLQSENKARLGEATTEAIGGVGPQQLLLLKVLGKPHKPSSGSSVSYDPDLKPAHGCTVLGVVNGDDRNDLS